MKRNAWTIVIVLAAAVAIEAGPIPPEKIPQALQPWTDWVLHGQEQALCPFFNDAESRQCLWPSRLVLVLDDRSGRFTQDWQVFRKGWAPLPGDSRLWPQEIKVDDRPSTVALRDGVPSVELDKGQHRVNGIFEWESLPELLPVPPETGLVSLALRGRAVPFPNREPQGQLWLQKRVETAAESSLDVAVHRMLTDEIPLLLRTRIELRVSGKSREIALGPALPDAFVPMSLASPLPARVEPDGRLRVQIRPGTWTIDLLARHEGPATALTLPAVEGPWDAKEVWVFDARPSLRLVTVEGIPAIDPQQTELPPEWRRFPAYLMQPSSTMTLAERRRGDSEPEADRIEMQRTWWLDFDGGGFTIRDAITGTLSRSWRLEMAPPTALGRVSVDGRDQFITQLADEPLSGIEIRQGALHVEADSRLTGRSSSIPAVGWNHDFQRMSAELHLPPGWRLFYASGVDDVSSSWLTDWTLLDLFVVLLTALAIARLSGWGWGTLALVTLALTYRESGAPGIVWLFVLAGLALVRALPEGRLLRFTRLYYLAAVVTLLIVAIPFMIRQVRQGLWPALEQPSVRTEPLRGGAAPAALAPAPAEIGDEVTQLGAALENKAREAFNRRAAQKAQPRYQEAETRPQIDPNALISTGPGLPRWSWTSISLRWRGPVERAQQVSLALLSPRMNLVLALLRVVLLAALVLSVARFLRHSWRAVVEPPPVAAMAAFFIALALVSAAAEAAEFPSKDLLEELRTRLLEAPECFPACASIPRLRLDAQPAALSMRIEVDAAAETAVPLPGSARSWSPDVVLLDGRPAPGMMRSADGSLWIEVSAGKHQISLEGPLPTADTVEIPLPLKPHRVETAAKGWTIAGLREDGLVEDNLQLIRVDRQQPKEGETLRTGVLPPFVRVERTLRLGLSPEVDTTISRLTAAGSAIVLEVPLLPGESVTSSEVRVEGGKALVSLPPQATTISWHSILSVGQAIELSAPDSVPWTEVWRVDASPIWHVEAKGIPVVHQPVGSRLRAREWQPWPGERVRIAVTRPAGVSGRTLTIDHSLLEMTPGLRATDVKLSLEMRSSRGADNVITLPENAELQSVTINGATQPIRQEKRSVTIPVVPGSRSVTLAWREPRGIEKVLRSPEVNTGVESVNADLRIAMPADRWTLLLGGPQLGPAVLFWSVLVVLLLIATVIGRVRLTPLRSRHWFLLGIGLTQVDISVAAVVAGWLLVLGWRRESGMTMSDRQLDLLQILLAAWTLFAFVGLVASIHQGLLGLPQMQITGNGSSAYDLRWTCDRATAVLPGAWVISVPLFVYRLAMLAWALWLSWAFIGWIRWGWSCFSDGGLWRPWTASRRAVTAPATPATES